ncbi:hypothetical protein B0H11DRAFT_1921945 [Mycena galericulata]|nr:hypothetical protein B0H11DRAFT_1921945 [Mycena galericulata]
MYLRHGFKTGLDNCQSFRVETRLLGASRGRRREWSRSAPPDRRGRLHSSLEKGKAELGVEFVLKTRILSLLGLQVPPTPYTSKISPVQRVRIELGGETIQRRGRGGFSSLRGFHILDARERAIRTCGAAQRVSSQGSHALIASPPSNQTIRRVGCPAPATAAGIIVPPDESDDPGGRVIRSRFNVQVLALSVGHVSTQRSDFYVWLDIESPGEITINLEFTSNYSQLVDVAAERSGLTEPSHAETIVESLGSGTRNYIIGLFFCGVEGICSCVQRVNVQLNPSLMLRLCRDYAQTLGTVVLPLFNTETISLHVEAREDKNEENRNLDQEGSTGRRRIARPNAGSTRCSAHVWPSSPPASPSNPSLCGSKILRGDQSKCAAWVLVDEAAQPVRAGLGQLIAGGGSVRSAETFWKAAGRRIVGWALSVPPGALRARAQRLLRFKLGHRYRTAHLEVRETQSQVFRLRFVELAERRHDDRLEGLLVSGSRTHLSAQFGPFGGVMDVACFATPAGYVRLRAASVCVRDFGVARTLEPNNAVEANPSPLLQFAQGLECEVAHVGLLERVSSMEMKQVDGDEEMVGRVGNDGTQRRARRSSPEPKSTCNIKVRMISLINGTTKPDVQSHLFVQFGASLACAHSGTHKYLHPTAEREFAFDSRDSGGCRVAASGSICV